MMEVFIPSSDEGCRVWPKEMEERYWELRKVYQGPMYCHVIKAVSRFPKELDKGKLASLRKKRLQRRMEEAYPLFAEIFMEEEMKRKTDYYNGITDPHLRAAREEVRMEHEAMMERYTSEEIMEKQVHRIIYTSIDDARDSVRFVSLDVMVEALRREKEQSFPRTTLIKMLESAIKKQRKEKESA